MERRVISEQAAVEIFAVVIRVRLTASYGYTGNNLNQSWTDCCPAIICTFVEVIHQTPSRYASTFSCLTKGCCLESIRNKIYIFRPYINLVWCECVCMLKMSCLIKCVYFHPALLSWCIFFMFKWKAVLGHCCLPGPGSHLPARCTPFH